MSDELEGDVLLPPYGGTWASGERELWLDLFQGYNTALMADTIEEHHGISKEYPMEQLKGDIRVAGELADAAMGEVQWRFFNHPQHSKRGGRAPRRTAPAPARSRGRR